MNKCIKYWGDVVYFLLYPAYAYILRLAVYTRTFNDPLAIFLAVFYAAYAIFACIRLNTLKKRRALRDWAYPIYGLLSSLCVWIFYFSIGPRGVINGVFLNATLRIISSYVYYASIYVMIGFCFARLVIWLCKRRRAKKEKDVPPPENLAASKGNPIYQKSIWRIVVISIIMINSIPVLFFSWGMYKTSYMSGVSSRDVEDYISERYLSFPGGEEIRGCIPAYEALGEYISLDFSYCDSRRKSNFFRTFFVSFGLLVEYSEEEYLERKRQAGVTKTSDDGWIEETPRNKIVESSSLKYVIYGVRYNDLYNYIEYVAICGDDRDDLKVWQLFDIYQWNSIGY